MNNKRTLLTVVMLSSLLARKTDTAKLLPHLNRMPDVKRLISMPHRPRRIAHLPTLSDIRARDSGVELRQQWGPSAGMQCADGNEWSRTAHEQCTRRGRLDLENMGRH
ncbi:uncharacterized protein [Panulirus ornatus]|uniref:uncharacterized protein n=1 Tax=Panulirus ornatus TaxID=150431 RepID=UPI003A89A7AE